MRSSVTVLAPAKLNLALDVVGILPGGYHALDMTMQAISLYERVVIRRSPYLDLTLPGSKVKAGPGNTAIKAALAFFHYTGLLAGADITIYKNVPVRAGMAGGSADAAATIHAMDALFCLGLSLEEKQKIGVKLGADIPYCLMGGTALSEGIGEILTKLPDVPKAKLVIAKPDLDVSTKFVYENLHADSLQYHPDIDGMVASIEKGDLCGITDRMGNVLETVTCKHYPVIEQMKGILKEHGAVNALMSGSGPTVFGIFTDDQNAKEAYEAMQEAGLARQLFLTGFADGRGREE